MNGIVYQKRKLSVFDTDFTNRVEEILNKVAYLERKKNNLANRKKPWENSYGQVPLITLSRSPAIYKRRVSVETRRKLENSKKTENKINSICYTEGNEYSPCFKISRIDFKERKKLNGRRKNAKDSGIDKKMSSKNELREWSRG